LCYAGHDVRARSRSRTRTPKVAAAAARIVRWDAAVQSVRIIVDSGVFAELREELLRRIPINNSEWTDYNASDPGVTLLELLAYLGERLLYRFNQLAEPACPRFSSRPCALPKAALKRSDKPRSPQPAGRRRHP
jgi:hypothetical protein